MRPQALQAPRRDARVRPHRGARLQPHVRDDDRPREGGRRHRLPAPRDGAGDLPGLQDRARLRASEAAVRHRPGRQVVPQRDHPRQLHLPNAGVRADGDGVLRAARRGPAVARALAEGAHGLVLAPWHPRRPPAPAPPRRRRAQPLLERHQRRRVPLPHRLVRARGHRQPRRLRPHAAREVLRREARVLRHRQRRALRAARHRARGRRRAHGPRRAVRRLRRGPDRRRAAHGAQAPSPPGADQGRRAAAGAKGRPARARARGLRPAARPDAGRVRRGRLDRQALPPPGRDRHALLRHDRPPVARGPNGHRARPRHARAGARRDRRSPDDPGCPPRLAVGDDDEAAA
jgi:hypothetical protein